SPGCQLTLYRQPLARSGPATFSLFLPETKSKRSVTLARSAEFPRRRLTQARSGARAMRAKRRAKGDGPISVTGVDCVPAFCFRAMQRRLRGSKCRQTVARRGSSPTSAQPLSPAPPKSGAPGEERGSLDSHWQDLG